MSLVACDVQVSTNTATRRHSERLAINLMKWLPSRTLITASCRTDAASMSSTRTLVATLTSLVTWQVSVLGGAPVNWRSTA